MSPTHLGGGWFRFSDRLSRLTRLSDVRASWEIANSPSRCPTSTVESNLEVLCFIQSTHSKHSLLFLVQRYSTLQKPKVIVNKILLKISLYFPTVAH